MTRLELPGHDLVGIRAPNPGPFTLSGTNSWIVGREPAWLVDPGPALEGHVAQAKPHEKGEENDCADDDPGSIMCASNHRENVFRRRGHRTEKRSGKS